MLLSLALLWASFSYSQNCENLVCSSGLVYDLPQVQGYFPVPATDFIAEDAACPTTKSLAIYFLWEVELVQLAGNTFMPDFTGARDTLWVDHCTENTNVVYVFRQLSDGTVQGCETFCLIGGDWPLCETAPGNINGSVVTPGNEPVSHVRVRLSAPEGVLHEWHTAEAGTYSLQRIGVSGQHEISASRLDRALNGVSTFD